MDHTDYPYLAYIYIKAPSIELFLYFIPVAFLLYRVKIPSNMFDQAGSTNSMTHGSQISQTRIWYTGLTQQNKYWKVCQQMFTYWDKSKSKHRAPL